MNKSLKRRKTVFISYAHVDGFDFTRRLVFALSMYTDVFWDKHLETGDFPTQLYDEIAKCDYFILVLSPFALRDGGWCRKELEHAQKHNNKGIALARVDASVLQTDLEKQLTEKYTFGDFTKDFEAGFCRLTQMILGTPYFSWEHVASIAEDNLVIQYLHDGHLPSAVTKSLVDWTIVDNLWGDLANFIIKTDDITGLLISKGTPRTLLGASRQCNIVNQQFLQHRNFSGLYNVGEAIKLITEFIEELATINTSDHKKAGELAERVVEAVKKQIERQCLILRDFSALAEHQAHFDFNVAEKIRELVIQYSRRSRYLY